MTDFGLINFTGSALSSNSPYYIALQSTDTATGAVTYTLLGSSTATSGNGPIPSGNIAFQAWVPVS
ncbi:MAG: hypothetical protein FWD12_12520, partial [Alphaproteobacteria bacterium]|nr:hypothetical protein [Alphaproteobacteria bacterium]